MAAVSESSSGIQSRSRLPFTLRGYSLRRWRAKPHNSSTARPELPAADAVVDLPPTIDNAEIIEAVHARRALTVPVSASLWR